MANFSALGMRPHPLYPHAARLFDGPCSYCTIICKGTAGRMICLAGRWLPTPALPFAFSSYIRQLVAHELVDYRIHVLYARTYCRRLASEVGVLEQSLCLASIELVLVYIRSVQI